jgi:hypothetical protein
LKIREFIKLGDLKEFRKLGDLEEFKGNFGNLGVFW